MGITFSAFNRKYLPKRKVKGYVPFIALNSNSCELP